MGEDELGLHVFTLDDTDSDSDVKKSSKKNQAIVDKGHDKSRYQMKCAFNVDKASGEWELKVDLEMMDFVGGLNFPFTAPSSRIIEERES